MKIPAIRNIRNFGMAMMTAGTVLFVSATRTSAQNNNKDQFETTTVTASGTNTKSVLMDAPDPSVIIQGQKKIAIFVVDISTNILYEYDRDGNPQMAYKVASGKKSTPTSTGVRIVTHTETYPYRTAPASTKRRKNPGAYGPRIICIEIIDPKTGKTSITGEFIHGNNDPNSLGKYVSNGCIRMDNEVIIDLAKKVKRGDIVLIKK